MRHVPTRAGRGHVYADIPPGAQRCRVQAETLALLRDWRGDGGAPGEKFLESCPCTADRAAVGCAERATRVQHHGQGTPWASPRSALLLTPCATASAWLCAGHDGDGDTQAYAIVPRLVGEKPHGPSASGNAGVKAGWCATLAGFLQRDGRRRGRRDAVKNDRTLLLGGDPIIPQICEGPGEPGLVSVLIPSYNRGYIIGRSIESVLAQTYRPIEIVVVDDGSTDETRAVVAQFGPAIRYLYQENGGLAAARNTGLAAAQGEFIAFQDSDDLWLPWKLQVQVALMRRLPELALVWTDMTAVTPVGRVVSTRHLKTGYHAYHKIQVEEYLPNAGLVTDVCPDAPPDVAQAAFRYGDIFSPMFMGNLVHPPTALLRRKHVGRAGGLDETFAWAGEDYEFFWRVGREGLGALVEAPSMLYRVEAEDQMTNPALHWAIARGYLLALQRRLKQDRSRITLPPQVIRRQMAEAYGWVAEEALRAGHGRRAAGDFLKSLLLNPAQKRALTLLPFSLVPPRLFRLARRLKQRLRGMLPLGSFWLCDTPFDAWLV